MKRLALVLIIPLLAVLFGFLGFLVSAPDGVLAQADAPTASSEPQEGPAHVKVGIYVLGSIT